MSTIADRAFCYSGRSGNLVEAGPQGFFYEDTRFLSEFVLLVNGSEPEVVDAGLVMGVMLVVGIRLVMDVVLAVASIGVVVAVASDW